ALAIDFVDVFPPEHSLRDGFTTYSVISPVRPGFVVTVASFIGFERLGTCIGAPGPHGFAVRKECRSSRDTLRVHRIPPRVRDDASAPRTESGCRELKHTFGKAKEKFLSPRPNSIRNLNLCFCALVNPALPRSASRLRFPKSDEVA